MPRQDKTKSTRPVGSLLDLIGRAAMDSRSAPARRIALFGLVLAVLFGLLFAALVLVTVVLGPTLAVAMGLAGAAAARKWLRQHAGGGGTGYGLRWCSAAGQRECKCSDTRPLKRPLSAAHRSTLLASAESSGEPSRCGWARP